MNNITNEINQSAVTTRDYQIAQSENRTQDKNVNEEQTKTTNNAASFQSDTLTVSEAGKAASLKVLASKQEDEQASSQAAAILNESVTNGTVLQNNDEGYVIKTDSTRSTVNLSSYSESELKDMYLNGEITKAKYDEELISRGIIE